MIFENGDKVLFIGDSVTDAGRVRPIGEGLHGGLGTGYVRCIDNLINISYPERLVRIVNMGTSGDNVLNLKNRWESDVLELKPDWLSICIGVNDVWRQFDSPCQIEKHISQEVYKATLVELINQTLPEIKGLILMSPYYMEPNKSDKMRARMDEYTKIVEEVATEHGAIFVNLQEEFDKFFEFRHSSFVAWDRVHPNDIGCMLIAFAFLKAVGFDRNKQGF